MHSFLGSQSIISSLSDEPPLVQAIFGGDADEVRSLIYKKEDVNCQDAERRSPLHAAAYLGDADIINLLILSGARINAKDSRWLTPLHRACASRSDDAVSALLKHQADVNARDKLWQSPLHVAAANDALSCAELLIPHLSNLNFSDRAGRQALHHAAFNGHLNIVNLLIKHGANIHAYDRQERRAIHWAAYMGHTEIIKVLVSQGAEIHCKDKRCGDTPMHAAAAAGQTSAVKMLLDLGFDINTQNAQKCTPLHLACFNGQDCVVHELLQAGADPNISNDQGCNSLHHAAASAHGALCLELLVNNGANVNVQNKEGKTPLHMTAVHGRFTRSHSLLESGARADILDFQGNSALHVAARHGHELLVTTLLEAGADPSKHGSGGKLAIHWAALKGHVNCCRKLLSAHASEDTGLSSADVIGICDEEGRSCFHHAACGGSLECLDVFLSSIESMSLLTQLDKTGRTPLHYALSAARRECARRLISSITRREDVDRDLNFPDKDGRTLLHHASSSDANGGCVELLLERGVNVLASDSAGYTSLHFAAACGHDTVVKLLVEADSAILKTTHVSGSNIPSPLHLASYYGHVATVLHLAELLLNLDLADAEGRTPLELAAFQGNAECMRALQMQGACVTQRNTKSKRTALHAAASYGHIHCMQLLIEGAMLDQSVDNNGIGKFVNGRDRDKCTPLMHCVTNGHLTAADFLMARNALVWPVDKFGCNALHRAAAVGREDILRNLIHHAQQQQKPVRARFSNSSDSTTSSSVHPTNFSDPIAARTHDGRTVLHFAAIRGNLGMLENLLEITNTVNVIDRYGYTPLHYASFEGQEPCVDAILLHDSFLKFEGSPSTPLHCAVYNDNEACAERLVETLGEEIVNLKDKKGRSPLHTCILNDYTDSAHFLLSHSADVDCTDTQGQSPLMLAASLGHDSSVEMLLSFKADCALVDVENNNALHLSCINENEPCALALLEGIEDMNIINAQNNSGQIALHVAAKKGLTLVTLKLLEKGSNVETADSNGLTPALACAPNNNVADCLDMLITIMLKFASSASGQNSFDMSSIRASLESCRRSQGSIPAPNYKINYKASSESENTADNVPDQKLPEETQDDSDNETY